MDETPPMESIWCSLYGQDVYLSPNETMELLAGLPAGLADVAEGQQDANRTLESLSSSGQNPGYRRAEDVLYSRVIVALGVFGLAGNIINLFVLTRKSLLNTLSRMEKFANTGLIALATSDLCFCLAVVPMAAVDLHRHIFTGKVFGLYYNIYNNAVINVFITFSTWLTVTLAAGRYYAISCPLQARQVTGLTTARRAIAILVGTCLFFNLPRFWYDVIEEVPCPGGEILYFREPNLRGRRDFYLVYTWSYFILAILLPLIFLTFCNVYLIRTLRTSSSGGTSTLLRLGTSTGHARAQIASGVAHSRSSTLTLIALVLMYTFLVCPGEIANVARETVLADVRLTDSYNLAIAAVNTLQAVNFSFNFVIYSAINVHFRRTMREFFFGPCGGATARSTATSRNENITMQTMLRRNGSSNCSIFGNRNDRQYASCRRGFSEEVLHDI